LSIGKQLKTLFNADGLVKTMNHEHDNKSVHFLDREREREREGGRERDKCFI